MYIDMLWTCNVVWLRCLLVYWCETIKLDWEGRVWNEWVRTNKEGTYGSEPARVSVHRWLKTMQDVFMRCFKKKAIQECTDLLLWNYAHKNNCCKYCNTAILIFCRLKINYDSNEFILEIGTVANTKAVAHTNPVAELEYTYVERPRKRQRWSTWKISMKCRILYFCKVGVC